METNVRSTIDGLPFSTEGYTRANNILTLWRHHRDCQRLRAKYHDLRNMGWTITSPGQVHVFDVSAMLLIKTSQVDYEELCKLDVLGLADKPAGDQGEVFQEFK